MPINIICPCNQGFSIAFLIILLFYTSRIIQINTQYSVTVTKMNVDDLMLMLSF